jgi:hypothetical protein
MPLAGAALGAASDAQRYLTDVGIDDKWMKETAAAIQPEPQRSSYWWQGHGRQGSRPAPKGGTAQDFT